jgi:hypothetical protein
MLGNQERKKYSRVKKLTVFFIVFFILFFLIYVSFFLTNREQSYDRTEKDKDVARLLPILDIKDKVHRQQCDESSLLMPACSSCIIGSDPPCFLSQDVLNLRKTIETIRLERYPHEKSYHLYPYLESPEFASRLALVAHFLANQESDFILEIGGNFQWIGRFIHGYCPKTIVMIDPVVNAESYMAPCGKSMVHIVTIPVTAIEFVEKNLAAQIVPNGHFNAVICIGCDSHWGIPTQKILSFPRPFTLLIEIASEYGPSVTQYGGIDKEVGASKTLDIKMDILQYQSSIRTNFTKRWFRIIQMT